MTRTCAGKLLRALGVKLRKTSRTHYACGSENTSWKGGRISNGHGYIQVLKPEHPRAKDGYVLEHILTMEKHLGRHLVYISMGHKNNEIVHHKNGNRSDNVLDNLEVMTHSEHMKLHGKINVRNIYKNKL